MSVATLRLICWLFVLHACNAALGGEPLSVLLLGDRGHHRPADFAAVMKPALAKFGIDVTYTDDVSALAGNLDKYDCVAIYRDSGDLPPEAEAGLLAFVEGGKGLVAIHCASHCFRNSQKYTALIGGRFHEHGRASFRPRIIDAQHPAMRGVKGFTSDDETYVHNELADDIRVLMVREHDGGYEPWTWVRSQGKGRVFYTASGHDTLTWREENFQGLVEAGTRWAAGQTHEDKPKLTEIPAKVPKYVVAGRTTEDLPTMQAPLSPADSMKHMHLPEGFRVELFAAEPDVVKPIAMNFDERGRLWVIESVDYPNRLLDDPHENGEDRIKICEDTDGDGRADKFTIFADKLNIPTALAFANGGVLVAIAPHTLFLKDIDGDDKADERTILFTGFGRGDTHAVHSNLHYAHDNWMYASVGYSGGNVKVGDTSHRFRQGFLRFKTDGSSFEVLTSTSNNTWGLGIHENGDIFGSTANNEHAVHLAIPNRYFEGVRGWLGRGSVGIEDHKQMHPATESVRQVDWFGGFTAASGFELYTGGAFPSEYNNMALVCEPTGHLVHLDKLVQRGTEFVARDAYNMLASSDAWTAPIAAQAGPDGAVWVLDWYNYIVQHNPTPHGFETGEGAAYVTPLRDREHGRIYRIVHESAKPQDMPDLAGAPDDKLIAALGHENLFWRLTAQRLLVEAGKPETVAKLAELARMSQNDQQAAHALRALTGLAASAQVDDEVLVGAIRGGLKRESPAVRIAALAAIPRNENGLALLLHTNSLSDNDALVRKSALLAMAEMPGASNAGPSIATMLVRPENANDRWIPIAATSAAARSPASFLSSLQIVKVPEQPAAVLQAIKVVAGHYARQGGSKELSLVLQRLANSDARFAEAAISGLSEGWPQGRAPEIDDEMVDAIGKLLEKVPTGARLQIAALANRWDAGDKFAVITQRLQQSLLEEVENDERSESDRVEAARQLIATARDEKMVEALLDIISLQSPPELASGILNAAAESSSDAVGRLILEQSNEFSPAARTTALAVLLRRPAWTASLLDSIEQGKLRADDLALDQRQQLTLHPDKQLASRAAKVLGEPPQSDRAEIVHAALKLAQQRGDRVRGKQIFTQQCAKCHTHSGEGNRIGPDLTGMAVHPREELLVHILDPSRSVEGNYRQYSVLTDDGRVLTGLLASETKTAVELLDAENKRHVVVRENIDELAASQKSMMPEGFEKLPQGELRDLLEFLTTPGKYLPLPLAKAATIVSTRGMFYNKNSTAEQLALKDWSPRTVQGVPFHFIDPQGSRVPNVIMLHGPLGKFPPEMPKSVEVPCNTAARAIHMLSGISGWGYPAIRENSVTMVARLHYRGGDSEDHELRNGEHFADYVRQIDVPGSSFAFKFSDQQMRYLIVTPKRKDVIERIELIKGPDSTAPIVMAITAEVLGN